MTSLRTLLLATALPVGLIGTAAAQQAAPLGVLDETAPTELALPQKVTLGASDMRGQQGLRGQDRAAQVRGMVAGRSSEAAVGEIVLSEERRGRFGRVHQRFEQRVDGRRLYGADVTASFGGDGAALRVHERVKRGGTARVKAAKITASEALAAAVAHHFPGAPVPGAATTEGAEHAFAANDFYYEAPRVEEVVVPTKRGYAVGYVAKVWSADTNELFHTLIGPKGEVLDVQDRTARDQYGIFPDHPGNSTQVIAQGPGSGNGQSPIGWLYGGNQSRYDMRGNNVRAYLDTNNSNSPDGGGQTVSDGSFIWAQQPCEDPSSTANKGVAVQNLFYLNNLIHDELYRWGFTEAAGNFQEDNFGRGGAGSDSVNAEAQDGGGVNNANFATPGDGSNPRMQMYIWNLSNPRRDGDLDSDIVWHEYGHGLTWRMIGNMSGSVSGAIGEGMADVLAIVRNDDDAVGEYSANDPNGIRRNRYGSYPRTLGDFVGNSVHQDGEIYAATIWRLKGLFNQAGLNDDALMTTLVEGMNFTAPAPDMIDMRNGILDAAPSSQDCLVWQAFAAFGMGEGAQQTANGRISLRESFNQPSACTGGGSPSEPEPPTAGFPEEGAWYSLTNVATGNVLDTDSNGRVDQFTSANAADKLWTFREVRAGVYQIINGSSGRGLLDTQNRGRVQWVTSTTSTRNDKLWRLTTLSDGSVRFDNMQSGRDFLSSNGSSAVNYTSTKNAASRWVPTRVQ